MRVFILIAAVAALAACSQKGEQAADNGVAASANEAAPAAFSINETTWEFTRDGKAMQESIDANGQYIATAGTEHVDHGTAVMKDGKACFTSAMTKEGEVCWTNPNLEVGGSGETVSDKGEKLALKRVAYVPKTL
jgi:hypothetical protein